MAIPVNGDDIIAVNFDYRYCGQQILLTTHWRIASGGTPYPDYAPFIAALLAAMDSAGDIAEELCAMYSTNVTLGTATGQRIYPVRNVMYRRTLTNGTGTNAAGTVDLPPNVALPITLRSIGVGRTQRATKHIAGVRDDEVLAGLITPAGRARLAVLADQLVLIHSITAGGVTNNVIPIIYHRANPVLSPDLDNYIVGTTSRVERRRTVGLGT